MLGLDPLACSPEPNGLLWVGPKAIVWPLIDWASLHDLQVLRLCTEGFYLLLYLRFHGGPSNSQPMTSSRPNCAMEKEVCDHSQ